MLTSSMPSVYPSENERRDIINQVLNDNLEIGIGVQSVASFNTGGTSFQSGVSLEYKNEKGMGKSDPYMESICYYIQHWSQKDGPTRHCCPWILVEVLGQEIGLSGAVWACG